MQTYVGLYKLTRQGVRDVKDSPKRIAAAKEQAADESGINHLGFYSIPQSEFDAFTIVEMPDPKTAAAMVLGLRAAGNLEVEMMCGFGLSELDDILAEVPAVTTETLIETPKVKTNAVLERYVGLFKITEQGLSDIAACYRSLAGLRLEGGEIVNFVVTPNSRFDAVMVLDMPSAEAAASLALAIRAEGNWDCQLVRGYEREQNAAIIAALP